MTTMTKTIQASDYADINGLKEPLQQMAHTLTVNGWRVDVGHHHRMWEYGRALLALTSQFGEQTGECRVLDVGAGWSVLGPTLAHYYGCSVTECEPDEKAFQDREPMIPLLNKRGRFKHLNVGVEQLPQEQYEAVFCISVLEHVRPEAEAVAWQELARRVKPNGVLFITVDCVPRLGRAYVGDPSRFTNYTTDMLQERMQRLVAEGMTPMGEPDWRFHGVEVNDYTFCSLGCLKGELQR